MNKPVSPASSPAIETHDLTVAYDKKPVLYGIDVSIEPGQLVGVIGPNGAGKSTLIKAITGMLPPVGGWVRIFGKPNETQRKRVAYVPQRGEVDWDFPVLVMDVVLMGRYGHLGLFKRPGKADRQIAMEALEKVQMVPFVNRPISNLSGGQQQRVFLARALAQKSDLYLMDEPFAGVDAATEATIINLLQSLRQEGKTIVVVHHDLTTARHYFDSLLLLNLRLVAYGPTSDVYREELLQRTYGGRLTLLSEVADAVSHRS